MFERKNSKAAKLTLEQVQEMRRHYGNGATQGALAKYYGVSVVQVGRIVRGESWADGAGLRMPTQAEQDKTLGKLLALQEQVNARKANPLDPLAAEVLGGQPRRAPPPMLLDGGDAPDETGGAGLSEFEAEVRRKAIALGAVNLSLEELSHGE